MRKTRKFLSMFLIIMILSTCLSSNVAYAEKLINNASLVNTINIKLTKPKGIYNGVQTLIYTGNKHDRWIHITPDITPNKFYLTMQDYNGKTVWGEVIIANTGDIIHRFVGANVKYVYLTGTPGGRVEVTDTEH